MDGFLTGLASFLSKSCFLTFLSVPSDLKWKIWSSNSSSKWQVHFQIRQIRTHSSYIEKFSFWVGCWETSPTQNTLRLNQPLTWSKLWKLWGIFNIFRKFLILFQLLSASQCQVSKALFYFRNALCQEQSPSEILCRAIAFLYDSTPSSGNISLFIFIIK